MKIKNLMLILKGFCVGGSMLVPGVSGGSMAIILGIYDNLIMAVGNFLKHRKNLCPFCHFFTWKRYRISCHCKSFDETDCMERKTDDVLFIGAVVGSIPMILKKRTRIKWNSVLFFILFLACLSCG